MNNTTNFFSQIKYIPCSSTDNLAYPPFFCIKKRTNAIEQTVQANLISVSSSNYQREQLEHSIGVLNDHKLKPLQILILKISNFVIKLFKRDFSSIDKLFLTDQLATRIVRKYEYIVSPHSVDHNFVQDLDILDNLNIPVHIKISLYELQRYQYNNTLCNLQKFKASLEDSYLSTLEKKQIYKSLPPFIKKIIKTNAEGYTNKKIGDNLEFLLKSNEGLAAPIDEVIALFDDQIRSYTKLIDITDGKIHDIDGHLLEETLAYIHSNDKAFKALYERDVHINDDGYIFDISTNRLTNNIPSSILEKPINVTMVAAEYAGLLKQGGLAEAVEGLSTAIKQQHPNNQVTLVFPKYSDLNLDITDLEGPEIHISNTGVPYNVYHMEINGVKCEFIDSSEFQLDKERPNIYDENTHNRFATFSKLAADLIYEKKDIDIIHLHDWHVSGIALKLKKDHFDEWKNGDIPPIVFTFHNNNRSAQGRITMGPYSYDPIIKGYRDNGITSNNENLFVETLSMVDGVTTVSETFGLESQQKQLGQGVSFAVKQAAKVGKMTGIINGANLSNWNPETNNVLKNWKDIDTENPTDLSYGPDSPNLLEKKVECKQQLQKWIAKYKPDIEIDFSKPVVTFIGRFDSYQKGLDKLEEAIDSTLNNGGQFICMGISPDPKAKEILDKLEKKYDKGVFFIRDYKDSYIDEKGNPHYFYHYQQGNQSRPGIGPLVRAASDFTYIPSSFEPCGLVQFEGWLFGSLAIGSNTGGLADSIIPTEKGEDKFNGFLFERKGKGNTSAKTTIRSALKFWQNKSPDEKRSLISRLIKEGRKYDWSSSPRGFTPAEKYRFAYENAKRNTRFRQLSTKEVGHIDKLKYRIRQQSNKVSKSCNLEEKYLKAYYSKQCSSKQLDKLYQKLPKTIRMQVPSPYGVKVTHDHYERYGAKLNSDVASFNVYAPNAKQVTVLLYDDNEEITGEFLLTKDHSGNWCGKINDIQLGQRYQYRIDGHIKIDPYGRLFSPSKIVGKAPFTVISQSNHVWNDKNWMNQRVQNRGKDAPMCIYELHPGIWKKKMNQALNYRELAEELVNHCQAQGFTHVELMGILEHPYELSFGYQAYGYFAPNNRMGTVDDFKYMIDYLHQNNIGVILDWVPNHFVKDDFALNKFDGSKLYESNGLKYFFSIRNFFSKVLFGSKSFNFKKKKVREFLISSAHFWLDEMHIDGLRVDAVRAMMNSEDKKSANLFMRDLNAVVHKENPGAYTIAEDYSGDRSVTAPYYNNGLGFDMKWHVGWTHKVLNYFSHSINDRKKHYNTIKSSIMCDNHHKQIMVLSHDHMKDLIENTQNTNPSDQISSLKSLMSLLLLLPGKKMQFMGTEWGNNLDWQEFFNRSDLGIFDTYDKTLKNSKNISNLVSELNKLYQEEEALHQFDNNGLDLFWINDPKKQIHAYRRFGSELSKLRYDAKRLKKVIENKSFKKSAKIKSAKKKLEYIEEKIIKLEQNEIEESQITVCHNFTNENVQEYIVTLPKVNGVVIDPKIIFNSDHPDFGGKGRGKGLVKIKEDENEVSYSVHVPPLSTIVIKEI